MTQTNKIWKYGDNINTDYIYPGVFTYSLMNEQQMSTHAMEGIDTDFMKYASFGDLIVAGRNWGCGSSREQAVKCLKARGIAGIIAKGFSRIFYRNAINEGLPIMVCAEAADYIQAEMDVSFDTNTGVILANGKTFHFVAYPLYVQDIINCGGLLPHVKATLHRQGRL